MEQLSLWPTAPNHVEYRRAPIPASRANPQQMAHWLSAQLGRHVKVTFTNNRTTMFSCRETGNSCSVRIHKMFADASDAIWKALVAYIGSDDTDAAQRLDNFIANSEPAESVVVLRPKGRFHDLDEILNDLNHRFFHDACRARVTWGTASARRSRRSIQLGCFVGGDNLIRIHPSLDQHFVPSYYVAWVVFHEMLHEVFGVSGPGRRSLHPPEFAIIEESYPDAARARAWEAENLERLLNFRPRKVGGR